MTCKQGWWSERRGELLDLAAQNCPLFVVNDETLNEILFDLAGMEGLERLFYPVSANKHPRILEKAYRIGAGFKCSSSSQLFHILKAFPHIDPESLLFEPDAVGTEGHKNVFGPGASVVLDAALPFQDMAALFREWNVILSFDLSLFPDPEEYRRIHEDIESMVTGFLIHSQRDPSAALKTDEAVAFISPMLKAFPRVRTLVLGHGIDRLMDADKGPPNVSAIARHIGRLREALPHLQIRLAPGPEIIAFSGALLTRVEGVDTRVEIPLVSIASSIETFNSAPGPRRLVLNLTRLHSEHSLPTRVTGVTGRPVLVSLPETGVGDILLITNTGALGPGASLNPPDLRSIPSHYLRARKMCPVPI